MTAPPKKLGSGVQVADAAGNWVDRTAPRPWRPYLRLARADRPIGTWLLMWPCWWGLALASSTVGASWPDPILLGLFALGAFIMRGAGCTYNDIIDRDIDAQVARTAARPIASGQVSVTRAWVFVGALCFLGLIILLTLNAFTILLGVASLGLIAIYPFMKRLTYWPQIFLGLAFNWGALMGWAAVTGALTLTPLLLYGAGIAWTLGYDTIYAHQDKDDDALVGVKSTALKFGQNTKSWLWGFYGLTFFLLALAGNATGLAWPFFVVLSFAGGHLVWQIKTLDINAPDNCLTLFRSNRDFGALIFLAITFGVAFIS